MRRTISIMLASVTVLLLLSTAAPAQFGRLKDLAKDKLKGKKEQTQSTSTPAASTGAQASQTASGSSDNSDDVEVPFERPANLTGVNMNVERQKRGTPEASPVSDKHLYPGRPEEVTLKLINIDASQIQSIRAQKNCTVTNARLVSATELKLTVQAPLQESGGDCFVDFRTADGRYLANAYIAFMGRGEVASQQRQETAMRESRLSAAEQKALARKKVGKLWKVDFEDGKSEQWTFVAADPDSPWSYSFKSSSGDPVTIQYMAGGNYIISLGDDCMVNGDGYEHEGTVTGIAIGEGCDAPTGAKFTATVQ